MLAAMCGVFSKENAVVLPGVMALLELSFRQPERKRQRALALGCLAVLPALAAMAYQRAAVLTKFPPVEIPFLDNPLAAAGFWSAKLTAVRLLAKYLGLLIWPARLGWDYSYAQIPMATGNLADWAGWMAVAAVGAAALLAYRFNRTVFFAIGFAFATFLPTSNLVLPIGTIFAERFLYLPAIALAICLVAAAGWLGRRAGSPRVAPMVLGVIGVMLAARTWERNADWRDSVTVTTAGVETSPHSYKTHGALALALFEADPSHANLDRVIAEAEKGLAILDGLPDNRLNSDAFLQAADYYRAKGAYQRELQLLLKTRSIVEANHGSTAAKFVELEDELSAAYLHLGDAAESAAAAAAAIGRDTQTAESYRLLAAASLLEGKAEDAAIALFEGLFATADVDLRSKLETLYRDVLGGQGCALLAGPNGPQINPSCEMVRRHACSAVARLIPVYTRLERQDLASRLQRNSEAAFGCQ